MVPTTEPQHVAHSENKTQHQDSTYRIVNVRCSSLAALSASIASLIRSDHTEQKVVRVGTSAENLVRVISVSVRRNLRFKTCGLESVRVGTSPKTCLVVGVYILSFPLLGPLKVPPDRKSDSVADADTHTHTPCVRMCLSRVCTLVPVCDVIVQS